MTTENTNTKTASGIEIFEKLERCVRWIREDIDRNVTNKELHIWSTSASIKRYATELEAVLWQELKDAEENEAIVKEGLDAPEPCCPEDFGC